MKRVATWQADKARTAKALRELPKCEECRERPGYGFALSGLWLCVTCATIERNVRIQDAQRSGT